jgi:hypothetical protein
MKAIVFPLIVGATLVRGVSASDADPLGKLVCRINLASDGTEFVVTPIETAADCQKVVEWYRTVQPTRWGSATLQLGCVTWFGNGTPYFVKVNPPNDLTLPAMCSQSP